jgi:hypothetical protein
MLRITEWFGRFGNNVIQIANCLFYAEQKNHSMIVFPSHPLFTRTIIPLNQECSENNLPVENIFYFIHELGIRYPSPCEMRRLIQEYLLPIFVIYPHPISLERYIHLRGGDVFSGHNIPNEYVQPPLDYYMKAIGEGNIAGMVYEDNFNPCVDKLLTNTLIVNKKTSSLIDDIRELLDQRTFQTGT